MRHHFKILFALPILLTATLPAAALWSADPDIDVVLAAEAQIQHHPATAPDGSGGAFVAWLDNRSSSAHHVYAQHLNFAGVPQWTDGGLVVADSGNCQHLVIAADGSGGIFLAWADARRDYPAGWDIFLQHLDGNGTALADPGGKLITAVDWEQSNPAVMADGEGGAFLAWQDYRNLGYYRIFGQRVDASGAPQWVSSGVLVSGLAEWNIIPQIHSDGSGNAIVAWHTDDLRVNLVSSTDGSPQWGIAGTLAAEEVGSYLSWRSVPDGGGGSILAFEKGSHLYASRVDGDGVRIWTEDMPIATAATIARPRAVADGAGGAYFCWRDNRNSGSFWAQRVDADGLPYWALNGISVSSGYMSGQDPAICPDGAGGCVLSWEQVDSGLMVQRLDGNGLTVWASGGVLLSSTSPPHVELVMVSDDTGGAIAAYRAGPSSYDIHAEHVSGDGDLGTVAAPWTPTSSGILARAWPNPFHSETTIEFAPRDGTEEPPRTLRILSVTGRVVRVLPAEAVGGLLRAHWDGRDRRGQSVPAGIYFVGGRGEESRARVVRLK